MTVVEKSGIKSVARTKRPPVSRPRKTWSDRLPPIAAVVGIIAAWQGIISIFGVPSYISPTPWQVLQTLIDQAPLLLRNFAPTAAESLAGFVFGNLIAILIAVTFVHNRTSEKAFYPIAVFVNTIPIIAIAPILVLIFGNGFAPKVMIAGLICFFPTLVNMVRGLRAVNPQTLDLMRVLSASKGEIFWKIRLQSSLPFLFAALKIAATTCVIGAIVGEWIGSNVGLGALIIEATYNFRSSLLYATVITAALWAVVLFVSVSVAERYFIRWKPSAVH